MNKSRPLSPDWFRCDAVDAAPALIGAILARRRADGEVVRHRIVETEAYMPDDPACHAYRKVTGRTRIMYGPPGYAYVYVIYGIYHCFNLVTGPEGSPQAVLVRALEALTNEDPRTYAGPGRLCRALGISLAENAHALHPDVGGVWIEMGPPGTVKPPLLQTTRVGVRLGAETPWRWYWQEHPAVSVKAKRTPLSL